MIVIQPLPALCQHLLRLAVFVAAITANRDTLGFVRTRRAPNDARRTIAAVAAVVALFASLMAQLAVAARSVVWRIVKLAGRVTDTTIAVPPSAVMPIVALLAVLWAP